MAEKLREMDMGTAKAKDRQGSYAGQYVAFDPKAGNRIVAHGPQSNRVAAEARRAGVEVPVIVYVPEENTACLYQMPIRDYPFITLNPYAVEPSDLVSPGGPNAKPYLWLRITNLATRQAMIVPAAIDTGADAIVMPATDAETLGHNLEATPPRPVRTAKGTTNAYPHSAAIDVLGILPGGYADESVVLYPIPQTVVYFTVGQRAHLVGQGSFLSRCILTINYPEQRFSVRLPDHS